MGGDVQENNAFLMLFILHFFRYLFFSQNALIRQAAVVNDIVFQNYLRSKNKQ